MKGDVEKGTAKDNGTHQQNSEKSGVHPGRINFWDNPVGGTKSKGTSRKGRQKITEHINKIPRNPGFIPGEFLGQPHEKVLRPNPLKNTSSRNICAS